MDLKNQQLKRPKRYEGFENTFVNVLGPHASKKTKVLFGNHQPHDEKNLRKTTMRYYKFDKANRTKLQDDIAK